MTPGQSLSRDFLRRAARPVIERVLAGAGYVAARLGSGSDVLGFDDHRSVDHDFGCRLTVLVDDENERALEALDAALEAELPDEIGGWPTRFATSWDERVRHKVDINTVHNFAASRLGFDLRSPLRPAEWMCLTGQSILEVTGGPVFHDTTSSYRRVAGTLGWYPDDLWRYVLAAGWTRLGQELPLVGRTAEHGDDAGSHLITARLCRDIMHLTFLVERRWMPYAKWTGTALRELPGGEQLGVALSAARAATHWTERQRSLSVAIEALAGRHRAVGFDMPGPVIVPFFDRPFVMPNSEICASLRRDIVDESVRNLPSLGSIEQWCDNVDLLTHPTRRARAVALYEQ